MVQAEPTGEHDQRSLVVIGSSAGGIGALSTLVATLPGDFPAPIVIAQHLDPRRPSALHTILARHSALPVRSVEEHAPLEAGVIFVIPANRHVSITADAIDLRVDGHDRPAPSINLLLDTAAAAYGERLIAVILTGMGSDGASGAHSVKKAGGTVIIQNPETAPCPAMPLALAPSSVDIVANLEQIGPILHDLLTGHQVSNQPDASQSLAAFLAHVRDQHGIDFSAYKLPTIRRRLHRRIVATNTVDLAGYWAYLEDRPEEYQHLISAFLIKVTEFFRDPDLFDHLRIAILPELLAYAGRRDRELCIWSAGCATGEEAYSIAILVAEILGHKLSSWNIRIFSTDLDAEAIGFARRGVYSAAAVEGIPHDVLARTFTEEDGTYRIRKHIRALTIFGQHDLAQRAPFPRIDLVICRNVLIYFTQELQKRALQLFAYSLRDRGVLVLGKAESTSPLTDFFALEQHRLKIYRRHGERIVMPVARLNFTSPAATTRRHPSAVSPIAPGTDPPAPLTGRRREGLDNEQLRQLPIGVVVVDRRYDIQTINSAARRLLGIYSEAIGNDLIHLAQHIARYPVREAIDRTFRSGTPTSLEPFEIRILPTAAPSLCQIVCYPHRLAGDDGAPDYVLVAINDLTDARGAHGDDDGDDLPDDVMAADLAPEVRLQRQAELIHRLAETNRQVMEANRELFSRNDELCTANEEFLLRVEESQAATEEIETLNEELQATNEELETLNEELQATIEELNTTNDELHARGSEVREVGQRAESERARLVAILDALDDALLVLAPDGTPLHSNAAYRRIFGSPDRPFVAEDAARQPLEQYDTPQALALRGDARHAHFIASDTTGTTQRYEADLRLLPGQEGEPRGAILIIRASAERDR